MERKEKGYFVTDEEVEKAVRYACYAGAGLIVLNILRHLLWPPVIRVINE